MTLRRKNLIRVRVKLRPLVAGVTPRPTKNTDAKVRFNSLVLAPLRSQELVPGFTGKTVLVMYASFSQLERFNCPIVFIVTFFQVFYCEQHRSFFIYENISGTRFVN